MKLNLILIAGMALVGKTHAAPTKNQLDTLVSKEEAQAIEAAADTKKEAPQPPCDPAKSKGTTGAPAPEKTGDGANGETPSLEDKKDAEEEKKEESRQPYRYQKYDSKVPSYRLDQRPSRNLGQ